jgi:hypothetical protein
MKNILRFGSDNFVYLYGPVDQSTGNAITSSPTGCEYVVFDESLEASLSIFETRLVFPEDLGSTSVSLPKFSVSNVINAGDTIRVTAENGEHQDRIVISIVTSSTSHDQYNFAVGSNYAFPAGSKAELVNRANGSDAKLFTFDKKPGFEPGSSFQIIPNAENIATVTDLSVTWVVKIEASEGSTVGGPASPSVNHPEFWGVRTATNSDQNTTTNLIRSRLSSGDMSSFPSSGFPTSGAISGDSSWGFRGIIEDSQFGITSSRIKTGDVVRIQIILNAGAGARHVTSILATVVEPVT